MPTWLISECCLKFIEHDWQLDKEGRMKQLRVISAIMALSAVIGVTGANAYDWTSREPFQAEWQQQHARISAGRKSGMLSRSEARLLRRELDALGEMPYGSRARDMLSKHSKKIASYKTSG
jgi:hypothetical protein